MNIEQGNKIIAEFMGHGGGISDEYNNKAARYDSSWLWLMPVVEKIESMGYIFTISQNYCNIQSEKDMVSVTGVKYAPSKIEVVWLDAIEFIERINNKLILP